MKENFLLLKIIQVLKIIKVLKIILIAAAVQADNPGNIGGHGNATAVEKDYNRENITQVNVTKDSKSLLSIAHHLLLAIKQPQKPTFNTPCGKPHCPGSPQPTGPSPPRTIPTPPTTPLPPIDVDNCTCISSALCLPSNTVNQGEGIINPRNLCQQGLVCCLMVPDIPIEIARLQWGERGRSRNKDYYGRSWGSSQGKITDLDRTIWEK